MYQIFDIALDSDIPLPELPEINQADNIIRIRACIDASCLPIKADWYHHWESPEGEICISCAKHDHCHILRFPDLADFIIPYSCDSVQYLSGENVPDETIRHLLLDQVIPRMLGQKGRLVLHASAVKLSNGKSIAFVGNSGWGKSTIASSFHESGATLLTDDCLLLENLNGEVIKCIPNYHGIRLFMDSAKAIYKHKLKYTSVAHYSEKVRLDLLGDHCPKHNQSITNLDVIFLMGNPETLSLLDTVLIEESRKASVVIDFFEQLFILDVTDFDLIAQLFNKIARIVCVTKSIYKIDYPRTHSFLPTVRTKIIDVLSNG
jgi:hypothetical protein